MSRLSGDIIGVLRGVSIVARAAAKHQEETVKQLWANSSVRETVEHNLTELQKKGRGTGDGSSTITTWDSIQHNAKETMERGCVVFEGVRQLAKSKVDLTNASKGQSLSTSNVPSNLDLGSLDISSLTLRELESFLSQHNKDRVELRRKRDGEKETKQPAIEQPSVVESIPTTPLPAAPEPTIQVESIPQHTSPITQKPELSDVARQRKVPSTRIGRMVSFGTLFAGVGLNTIGELTKGALGLGGSTDVKTAVFNSSNAERIVDTLCKVRGAALKIGQILSIQDSSLVSPELAKAFERVRQSADYMPDWQVERTLKQELGSDWESKLLEFDRRPFAAASIGQVHRGVLHDGRVVAIKIQYPGVAQSIESDIDNLVGMLKVWNVFPPGIFIDNIVRVAKRELAWEVDYLREADFTSKFGEMVAPYPEYKVPEVHRPLTTKSILTTEFVPGVPLDQCFDLDYDHRRIIGKGVMNMCIRELFIMRCMQTDPNWSNFLYDPASRRLMLIDFGSTRFYTKEFIDNYLQVTMAAAQKDRNKVLKVSEEMGFLTGYESKAMKDAHVDAVMILGEVFSCNDDFDFGAQDTAKRIVDLVPTMVAHRLCPPPDEIYSIHRKLSGVFFLCSRLNVKFNCRELFDEVVREYKFG